MYKIYITDALVCGVENRNTSDRSYRLFTREAGMVWAVAKSAREARSKHRYALQEFSHARVSLVRGKAGWRLTGAEPFGNFYFKARTRDVRAHLCNTIRLLSRFIHGEDPIPPLFDDVLAAFGSLGSDHAPDPRALETVLALRILFALGYVAPEPSFETLLSGSALDAYRGASKGAITAAESAIESASLASQL